MNYQYRPVLVDAYRWDGKALADDHDEPLPEWLLGAVNNGKVWHREWKSGDGYVLMVSGLPARDEARPGDWIVLDNGKVKVFTPSAFRGLFEPANQVAGHHLLVNGVDVGSKPDFTVSWVHALDKGTMAEGSEMEGANKAQ